MRNDLSPKAAKLALIVADAADAADEPALKGRLSAQGEAVATGGFMAARPH